MKQEQEKGKGVYLSALGAWALAFGCSVGWGAFVMPGTTFLPIAGPAGTAAGILAGGLVMLILAANFHYLMNRYRDGGGTYTYTKKSFGYDHGFLSAWFLILTYIAILWANATALPLIARTVMGDIFQFGFLYEIAGYRVWFGEILLAVSALVIAAVICLYRTRAARTQILMAVLCLAGIVVCFIAALGKQGGSERMFQPPFAPDRNAAGGAITIFALCPWAYVGFESITHSAAEARFSLKRSFRIMAVAVGAAAAAYVFLTLMASSAQPEGSHSWPEYMANLGNYGGTASLPTFYAANNALGTAGTAILGTAALGAIVTGLIGNYIALSRLLGTLADDGMLPGWMGTKDRNQAPRNAILCILGISVILPFLGRTAISWIVDVTTVGATIAYAFASASAWKTARAENNRKAKILGLTGMIIAILFAVEFLIPNLTSVKALSTESYLILALWSICGFLYFRFSLRRDRERRLGHSIVAWVVLLGLIIFTSSVWMRQTTEQSLATSVGNISDYYSERMEDEDGEAKKFLQEELDKTDHSVEVSSMIQIGMIIFSIAILLEIYGQMQKREKQIEIEKALAEESSRAKTSFLSNMSHEIRTPMNAIIGLDKIALRDPELTPRTRDHLEKIGASAKHMLGLINDILDMSRIESGRMVLKTEEFSFREFLDQINIMISGQCMEKGLHYECNRIGQISDYYIGDDMKLKQVLINILGNSVKFTDPPGSVSLTVEQTEARDGKCVLRFVMKDTGVGMDPEFLPKIFETFSQEDATNTNRYGGSGLGMAISKNIVEMMAGSIQVESEKGKGSAFTVNVTLGESGRTLDSEQEQPLPDGGGKSGAEGNGTGPASEEENAKISLAGKRVLMAEDVEQNAEILADLLELEDIESELAVNGAEAVRLFSENPPGYYDAILMDVRMPVMDGLNATREIRAMNRADAKTIPIIAMTANVFDEDVERSLQAGMNAHLSKPVVPEIMYKTIGGLIAQHQDASGDNY